MAKHTRGLVTRALCQHGGTPKTPKALAEALSDRFEVDLVEPEKPGKPWTLKATARAA